MITKIWYVRMIQWLSAWLDLLCALISIVTFTIYRPWWDLTFRLYWTRELAKARIKQQKIHKEGAG